jgi:DNA-binding GntR family transcriptional regulator
LRAAFKCLEEAYRSKDFEEILDAKKLFYDAICVGAKNAVVRDLLGRLSNRINQLRSMSRENDKRWLASLRELKRLASALDSHDPRAARAAAIKHVIAARAAALPKREAGLDVQAKTDRTKKVMKSGRGEHG